MLPEGLQFLHILAQNDETPQKESELQTQQAKFAAIRDSIVSLQQRGFSCDEVNVQGILQMMQRCTTIL